MGATENGRPIESTKDRPNGHPVGGSIVTIRKPKAPTRSWSAWLLSNGARLAVWYTVITIFFRCPSDLNSLNDDSPQICKSYLSTRDYLQPHVQPYYDTYAGPYVDKVSPYAAQINGKVLVPVTVLTKKNYQKFAAPQIDKARALGLTQWEKSVVPQIQLAQAQATKLYDANIAPHVKKASDLTSPYYNQVRDTAQTVHKNQVLPALDLAGPYVQKGYTSTQAFLLGTAYPIARHSWSNTVIFVDGTLWPFLKGVYSDNVRPQLVMISDRISKYQERRKLQAIVDGVDDAFTTESVLLDTTSTISDPSSTSSATVGPSGTVTDSDFDKIFADEEETPTGDKDSSSVAVPVPKRERATDDSIAKDLREWQTKFALAADKGMDDLKVRAGELAADLAKSDIEGLGRGLENALQKTIDNELETVKAKIVAAVSALPEEDSSEAEKSAAEDIVKTIRASGLEIKNTARKVRDWAQKFERDVDLRIARAASSTLEVIDGIRDLGLQEIGMRWAWMDGVTYKHWEKFHELKRQLNAWSTEVREAAVEHPEASAAKETARQILEESMALTEDAAKELVKLKEVAKWKIRAHDSTDDFELRAVPAAAAKVAAEFASSSASLFEDLQGTVASVASDASGAVDDMLSSASTAVLGSSTGTIEAVASQASEAAEDLASSASSVVVGSTTGSLESAASAVRSGASEIYDDFTNTVVEFATSTETISLGVPSASEVVESASSVILGSTGAVEEALSSGSSVFLGSTGTLEQAATSASSLASAAQVSVKAGAASVSSVIFGTTDSGEKLLSTASSIADDVSDVVVEASEQAADTAASASSKVSSVFAMAQTVPKNHLPIFDDFFDDHDDDSYSSKLQDMVNGAGENYAQLTDAVSQAIYGTSRGPVDKATSLAASQYSQAMMAASAVLFPTPQGTAESLASIATDRFSSAVEAARSAFQATPTHRIESVLASMTSQAESAYSQAVEAAKERYLEGKAIASEQIIGTKLPVHERMLAAIESAWNDAQQDAVSRRDSALSAAASHYSSLSSSIARTQGPMASISSVAASRLSEAVSLASQQYSSVQAAIGATPTPQHQQVINSARKNMYEAVGFAQEQYTQFLSGASQAVYGTPTLGLEHVITSVSEAVLGSQTPAYESALNVASSNYAFATAAAIANMESLLAAASSAVGATKKTPMQSVIDKIQSEYDVAILAASSSLSAASYAASTAVFGAPSGSFESISQVAADNWQAIVAQASQQIYATSKPFYEEYASSADEYYQSALSQAGDAYNSAATKVDEYASQITDSASDQYAAVQAYVSELVLGREPDFTESVMSRLQSAYYTGVASYASEVYGSATSIASVASAYFQPPPAYTAALDSFQSQLDAAVSAASAQVYGTSQGAFAQATEAIVENYESVSSAASEAIYGTEIGYAESATAAFAGAASSAQDAISLALFGTPTGTAESIVSAAGEQFTSVTQVIAENVDAAQSVVGSVAQDLGASVSSLVYGPEQGALESAQAQISAAVASAQSRIASMASQAADGGSQFVSAVSSNIEEAASVVGSSVSAATDKIKDEL